MPRKGRPPEKFAPLGELRHRSARTVGVKRSVSVPRMDGAANPAGLERIEHLVVLMLENRSFDHTLGYFSLPEHQGRLEDRGELRVDVRGLGPGMPVNKDADGNPYTHEPLDEDVLVEREIDPPHDKDSVATQLAGGEMTGFVEALQAKLVQSGRPDAADPELLKTAVGYLTPSHVPVYDQLARNFCVCDNFFCSVPGPTMPNRFFAVAGTCDDELDNTELLGTRFGKFKSLFRYLEPESWRWYSSDPAILRAIDEDFMFDNDTGVDDDSAPDNFAYFDQLTERQPRSFLRDVLGDSEHEPDLRRISWIDPNFALGHMVKQLAAIDGVDSNDDHPPSKVVNGQRLVHKVYRALIESRYRDHFLLVIMYDEHGGFFDHEQPPAGRGPRIPALLVSPHVKRGVCHEPLEHASVIKTILLHSGKAGKWKQMTDRVTEAHDLSVALREDGSTVQLPAIEGAGASQIERRHLVPAALPPQGSTADHTVELFEHQLTDLQKDVRVLAVALRTGYRFYAKARKWELIRKLGPLLARLRKPRGLGRLESRRP